MYVCGRTWLAFSCLHEAYIPFHGRLYICREDGASRPLDLNDMSVEIISRSFRPGDW